MIKETQQIGSINGVWERRHLGKTFCSASQDERENKMVVLKSTIENTKGEVLLRGKYKEPKLQEADKHLWPAGGWKFSFISKRDQLCNWVGKSPGYTVIQNPMIECSCPREKSMIKKKGR